ncbi:hypothetical protein Patl_3108 [Paraglaciecola sp. T6c]|uniref:trypsin-like serine peptidase n=1 Tax=Pseudoalteromonas atlantica (strain T6c / ATCC BAA-1087) TaxID=3042615 RepID=UPI00005C52DE|nr:trypsin-like peptidase domain-containing protein [Paraglaciecola sp. T6c]ABG41614.1 hypothetical protein Patl_3108 [Paraglaciecola sp. T6c]
MTNGNEKDVESPLAYDQVAKFFARSSKGKIPKELQSMLLPELKSYKLKSVEHKSIQDADNKPTIPMIPKWFGTSPKPCKAKLAKPTRVSLNGKDLSPLTVFNAEDRRIYNDTSYPWGTICKVVTSSGSGSGVIVGPRHVLTASHVVDWSSNGAGTVEVHRSAGSLRASTSISRVWFYTKITGRTVSWFEVDEDYAVLVTSDRIGDLFGWMGTRTYNSSWDGEPYWFNIGYPGSIGGALRPTYQRDKKLDEPWYDLGPGRSMSTHADLTPGNSGGPMFAFWNDGPYVVAVASAEASDENWCSGGSWMTNLVRHAREQDA